MQEAKVGQHLLGMYRKSAFNRLDFDNDDAFHKQVDAQTFVELQAIVFERHRFLPGDIQAPSFEIPGENRFVNRFQESRPQTPV